MSAPPEAVFPIKGFAINGENPLGSGETSEILAPFLRADATLEVLQRATAALEKALQDRGYSLYRVVLPPQALSDTITLNVVRFALGKVQLQGNGPHFDDANVRRALPSLKEGTSPNLLKLARETAVANENPSRQLVVSLKQAPDDESLHATVRVTEQRPWSAGVAWNNAGTRETGRDRLSVAASYNNLFNRDHVLGAAYTTSVDQPSHVKQVGLTYRAPFYDWGGVAFASVTDSDVVGTFGLTAAGTDYGTFESTAAGRTYKLGYSQYLVPKGGYRAYITFAFEDKLYRAAEVDGQAVQDDRRSRPVSLAFIGRREAERQVWAYHLEFALNVGSGGGNSLSAYRTENSDIDTIHWKAVRGGASIARELAGGWQLQARGAAQWSPDLLIAGEAFGLGGVGSIRGVPDRVLYGDSGLSFNLEAYTPEWVQGLRGSAFVDAGLVRSDVADRPERRQKDRLASVGVGLRYAHPSGANLSADYGYVVTGSRADRTENPSVPDKGDDKFHVSVSYAF
ncbi:hemolysin activation/secretion protein [Caldimonas brevitalea]|uniref:Hemolysin activation/secretion protein n=1 Tax=Caldimonas brevitalea TaxID=413882 RepID=A0A0G3BF29_9BURK|nr:hemolysin activation/secretion protein [Caldimonas brevitalea]